MQKLKEHLPKFLEDLETKGRSPSTIIAYRADLEQMVDFLEIKNKSLTDNVESDDLTEFRDHLSNKNYTPKSVSRKLNAIKTFFRWLVSAGHVTRDPSREVSHPKVEPATPKFLAPLEYRALRDIARSDPRLHAIVELILQTGVRISEVANLKVENILEEHIHIEAYATQPARKVPLNQAVKDAINKYLKSHRIPTESKHVFVSKNGKPLATRNIRAAVDRLMQKAEIGQYSVNDIRNTFIVENLKREVDLVFLSQVSGHKRLSTTERYLELAGIKSHGKKQKLEEL